MTSTINELITGVDKLRIELTVQESDTTMYHQYLQMV
ncbi:MAG: hypothetical protein JWR87_3324 [Segetibacter sp.]|jgi:hypothetical protein|nr:hypothetical protein [Segetibacter sp.]